MKKTILVVDDNPLIRKMLGLALGPSFALVDADSADAALVEMNSVQPDGMVLDVMMPGTMNGFQLCERIKNDPLLKSIHVVMVTACGQEADRALAMALGADAYFVKPFSPVELVDHFEKALRPGECAS